MFTQNNQLGSRLLNSKFHEWFLGELEYAFNIQVLRDVLYAVSEECDVEEDETLRAVSEGIRQLGILSPDEKRKKDAADAWEFLLKMRKELETRGRGIVFKLTALTEFRELMNFVKSEAEEFSFLYEVSPPRK